VNIFLLTTLGHKSNLGRLDRSVTFVLCSSV